MTAEQVERRQDRVAGMYMEWQRAQRDKLFREELRQSTEQMWAYARSLQRQQDDMQLAEFNQAMPPVASNGAVDWVVLNRAMDWNAKHPVPDRNALPDAVRRSAMPTPLTIPPIIPVVDVSSFNDHDWRALAGAWRVRYPQVQFGQVVGRTDCQTFVRAFDRFRSKSRGLLLVDDVWRSNERLTRLWTDAHAKDLIRPYTAVHFAVGFAASDRDSFTAASRVMNLYPLFKLWEE